MSKTYFAKVGYWDTDDTQNVFVKDEAGERPLPLRLEVCNHSPTGFAWGYGGSGPAQLSFALLADATGDDELAGRHYQTLKWKLIAGLDQHMGWSLTREQIIAAASIEGGAQ